MKRLARARVNCKTLYTKRLRARTENCIVGTSTTDECRTKLEDCFTAIALKMTKFPESTPKNPRPKQVQSLQSPMKPNPDLTSTTR